MVGRIVMEGVVRSEVANFKWPMFGSSLGKENGMTKKGQYVPPLPLETLIFWPSKLGGQWEIVIYFPSLSSLNL